MSDIELPSLDDLPTQPPPPAHRESRNSRTRPLASRDSYTVTRPLTRLTVLLVLMHLTLSAAAYVVAVEQPPMGVALAVVVAGNVVWAWCFVTMLSMLGRGR